MKHFDIIGYHDEHGGSYCTDHAPDDTSNPARLIRERTMYAIEYLDAHGFWRALEQSSIETGFKMRPHPTFATRAEAEAHIVELQSAGTWRGLRVSPACTGEFVGQDGELLSPEAPITTDVAGDQWCAGHYDGNSTWEPLGSDYSACDCECCTVDPCTGPGHAAGCIHQ